ncbi:glycerate kinase, partial [Salmonella enterica subsp. enterica serovar Typhimurium]|uniref:glycerate kinase n=1 Tax=Salmonella enterica TaxID=28901 RepID=UPI000CB131DD
SLVYATGGQLFEKEVHGPLGNKVNATYGILDNSETAAIEMASASGIHLVSKDEQNFSKTSTFGTGELIKECLDIGIKKIILGIG